MSQTDNLVGLTVKRLIEYIRIRKLRPGDALPKETELIRQLSVSRNVVREAISYLKGLGIITSRRGSAFKVAAIDPTVAFETLLSLANCISSDPKEIFQLRAMLELGSIGNAVLHASENQIGIIIRILDELEKMLAAGCSRREFILKETEFHMAIAEPANCRLLSVINNAIKQYFQMSVPDDSGQTNFQSEAGQANLEHRVLANAFQLRAPEIALLALHRHLQKLQRKFNAET